jgi:hypothetical protein
MVVEQSSPQVHESLQAEVSFLVMIQSEAKNLPPPRVDA